jgi:hypothetical protein
MLVEKTVVVELKVVEKLAPAHVSQVLTYLRLSDLQRPRPRRWRLRTNLIGLKRLSSTLRALRPFVPFGASGEA